MGRDGRRGPLGTAEARKALPDLVRKATSRKTPAAAPKRHAVEIKARGGQRSASLVPTIDLDAAEERIENLEEQLEDAGIALFLHERLSSTTGERLSSEEFLRGIGMDEFVGEIDQS